MPEITNWLQLALGGGDQEADSAVAGSNAMQQVLLPYLQDVLSGRMAARGLPGNTYNSGRSFAANATDPRAIEQAMDLAIGFSGGGLGIKAYHGSPHDFDKFDMSKIGTGEGAQAYGRGLYFAENPEVANEYRVNLSRRNIDAKWDGKPISHWGNLVDSLNDKDWRVAKMLDDYGRVGGDLPTFIQRQSEWYRDQPQMMEALGKFQKRIKSDFTPGKMYEVNLDALPGQFLNFDRPLGMQPDPVKSVLGLKNAMSRPTDQEVSAAIRGAREAGVPMRDFPAYQKLQEQNRRANETANDASFQNLGISSVPGYNPADLSGGAYITGLQERFGHPAQVSSFLNERGIPGVRYLDQGSRASLPDPKIVADVKRRIDYANEIGASPAAKKKLADELAGYEAKRDAPGTHNYSVWDESIIQLARKYGILPPLAATGAAAMQDR